MIGYLPAGKTMLVGQYCAELMFKLRDVIKQKYRGELSLGVWLLHNNAPVHKSVVALQALYDYNFIYMCIVITGSIARSANLPVFSLLRGQF